MLLFLSKQLLIWLCFLFGTLIFSNLCFMATREFLSSFERYFRFTNLLNIVSVSPVPISTTSTSLLLALSSSSSSSSSLLSPLSEVPSFRSSHSFLRYSAKKGWTVEVALGWKFQLNIVFTVKKRLSNGWLKK